MPPTVSSTNLKIPGQLIVLSRNRNGDFEAQPSYPNRMYVGLNDSLTAPKAEVARLLVLNNTRVDLEVQVVEKLPPGMSAALSPFRPSKPTIVPRDELVPVPAAIKSNFNTYLSTFRADYRRRKIIYYLVIRPAENPAKDTFIYQKIDPELILEGRP